MSYGQKVETSQFFSQPEDLIKVTCQVFHDEKYLKDVTATEFLGNPLNSLQWPVKKLKDHGLKLHARQRVSRVTFLLLENLTTRTLQANFNCILGSVTLKVK